MLERAWLRYPRDRCARALKQFALFVRGIVFLGWRLVCPCCGWHLRAFVGPWGWRATEKGYCPRCNAKARHRRLWLYLRPLLVSSAASDSPGMPVDRRDGHRTAASRHTGDPAPDAARPLMLLDVAPWPALARRAQSLEQLRFVGVDLRARGAHVTVVGNVTALPFAAHRFDVVICQHVLEHVEDDLRALTELFRVTRPGGHVLVSVPIRLDSTTHEDPSIVDPEERLRLFGERGHVRFYGRDLSARLTATGFRVELDLAHRIPADLRERHGLRTDEHIFHCRKPVTPGDSTA